MALRIEDYGMIGDLQTAALVGRDGSIDWLCLPRFDSGACFAALLGTDDAGFWRLAPARGGMCSSRRYRDDSLILETEWDTPEGSVRVIDAMPPRGQVADVVRVVEGLSGCVQMTSALRLRFDHGRIVPWIRHLDGQLAAVAGPDAAWLSSSVPQHGEHLTTYAEFSVRAGDRVPFVLTYRPSHEPVPEPVDPEAALAETASFWSQWIGRCDYSGQWRACTAILGTPQGTDLRSHGWDPGGSDHVVARGDRRRTELGLPYCWLRDATFTLQALLGTGYIAEAKAWREWLLRAVAGDPAKLQIMYGIDGTQRLPECRLDWLTGYQNSAPVRVGNAASEQFQLDVWGEVLDGLHLSREAGIEANAPAWDLQRALLDYLEGHWQDPDNSLWEIRGRRRHFVHSRVMAWAGIDRAVDAVERYGLEGPTDQWKRVRDAIHAEVCQRGYDTERNTFTQFYGSSGLDAALLLIPRVGFLPWNDPRVTSTVEAVQRELCIEGFLLRYDTKADGGVDGVPGSEGAFITCTIWLVDALCGIGRREEARDLFERLLSLRNDVGLLSEEYDPATGRQLGNTPQAFSHVGLVNAARHLAGARPAQRTDQVGSQSNRASDVRHIRRDSR